MATAALLLLGFPVAAPGAAEARAPAIGPGQEIATIFTTHAVRSVPRSSAPRVSYLSARRPITHARTVLPVLGRTTDSGGRSWLRVRMPGRALGRRRPPRTGWITAAHTRVSTTAWHLVVDLSARRVTAHRSGRVVRRFSVVIGTASTPTPRGRFFVEENVRLPAGHSGAPFALATSARSNVIQEFAGGPGQIALHGMRNIGGRLGTAASHGCIRLSTRAISWLAARIRPGVPITVVS